MSIISKETFDKFTKEEKEKLRRIYSEAKSVGTRNPLELENLFGKENLQPKPIIKTWEDIEKDGFSVEEDYLPEFNDNDMYTDAISYKGKFSSKIIHKAIATLKITKLIELGYGGIVSKEEWSDKNTYKCYIVIGIEGKLVIDSSYENWQEFISFHTRQQAEEFMSYPENVKLLKQYYMM